MHESRVCLQLRPTHGARSPFLRPDLRRRWILAIWLSLLAWALPACAWAQEGRRVALLIGNQDYKHERKLRNPVNDAELLGRVLKQELRFDMVRVERNLDLRGMDRVVDEFAAQAQGAATVVFYYSGHGLTSPGDRRAYLLPIDARIGAPGALKLERQAVAAEAVRDRLRGLRAGITLLFLDACRDGPGDGKSGSKGLARMGGGQRLLVAYAAEEGKTAADGDGVYSPYAEALAHAWRRTDLSVMQQLDLVYDRVNARHPEQQPTHEGNLRADARLVATPSSAARPAASPVQVAAVRPEPVPATPVRPAAAATVGSELKDCDDCPTLVVLPTGRFQMGSPPGEAGRYEDEGPVHEVKIGYRLAVGKTEVTRGEFARFVQATGYRTEAEQASGCAVWNGSKWAYDALRHWRDPGYRQEDSHPVVCVSWNDAQAYLKWLNGRMPGKGYRLLSEAEWEYAARSGQGGRRYPWGDDAGASAQCAYANGMDTTGKARVPGGTWSAADCNDGHAYTAPAESLKPNAFGLHHMHGNVWEWVQDVWRTSYQGVPSDGSTWVSGGDGARRVLRGGAWVGTPGSLRSASRNGSTPDDRSDSTGLRIARTF